MKAFKTKPVVGPDLSESIERLGVYWETIDEVTQGHFELLYGVMPEKVSEVLAGAALPRDDLHLTLRSWVESASDDTPDFAALPGFAALQALQIQMTEVSVGPPSPDIRFKLKPEPGQPFVVSWTGQALADFPARKDLVAITYMDGGEVARKIVEQEATPKGPVHGEARFDGLARNEYRVVVVVNREGDAPGQSPDRRGPGHRLYEHGVMTEASAVFAVGNFDAESGFRSAKGEYGEDQEKFDAARDLCLTAVSWYPNQAAFADLVDVANRLASMPRLSLGPYDGRDGRIKAELARISSSLIDWAKGQSPTVAPSRLAHWPELMSELKSACSDDAAALAEGLIQVVDKLVLLSTEEPVSTEEPAAP
jgi:hypothetical protein